MKHHTSKPSLAAYLTILSALFNIAACTTDATLDAMKIKLDSFGTGYGTYATGGWADWMSIADTTSCSWHGLWSKGANKPYYPFQDEAGNPIDLDDHMGTKHGFSFGNACWGTDFFRFGFSFTPMDDGHQNFAAVSILGKRDCNGIQVWKSRSGICGPWVLKNMLKADIEFAVGSHQANISLSHFKSAKPRYASTFIMYRMFNKRKHNTAANVSGGDYTLLGFKTFDDLMDPTCQPELDVKKDCGYLLKLPSKMRQVSKYDDANYSRDATLQTTPSMAVQITEIKGDILSFTFTAKVTDGDVFGEGEVFLPTIAEKKSNPYRGFHMEVNTRLSKKVNQGRISLYNKSSGLMKGWVQIPFRRKVFWGALWDKQDETDTTQCRETAIILHNGPEVKDDLNYGVVYKLPFPRAEYCGIRWAHFSYHSGMLYQQYYLELKDEAAGLEGRLVVRQIPWNPDEDEVNEDQEIKCDGNDDYLKVKYSAQLRSEGNIYIKPKDA